MVNYEQWRVTVPEGELDGVKVSRRGFYDGNQPEDSPLYWFTDITADGNGWMDDTDLHIDENLVYYEKARELNAKRCLTTGLGIGLIVKMWLTLSSVERIDIIEFDPRVISLVGPHYNDPRVKIHLANALEPHWNDETWDVVYHDIWNYPVMDEVEETLAYYEPRCTWQGWWDIRERA